MKQRLKRAPLSQSDRTQLRADAKNLKAAAIRKQVTLDRWDEARETAAAKTYFELGEWLFYYSRRVYGTGPQGLSDRIDCARRIYESGLINPGYQFFTVFDFGERQYDTIFEMGDAEEVVDGLRLILQTAPTEGLANAFKNYGWPATRSTSAPQAMLWPDLQAA